MPRTDTYQRIDVYAVTTDAATHQTYREYLDTFRDTTPDRAAWVMHVRTGYPLSRLATLTHGLPR